MPKWPLTRASKEVGSPDGQGNAVATANPKPRVSQAPVLQSTDPAPVPLADDLIRRIVKAIDEWAAANDLTNLPRKIVFEQALTPLDIHQRYKVLNGAIYGISSHGRWNGAFKPANASPDLEGLYLAGGAAHPGPGMPMVMMSGWIAADALDQHYREQALSLPA